VPYGAGLALQEDRVDARKRNAIPDTLLLLEHEPVFTLGRNARIEHLLLPREELERRGFAVFDCGRGGDITYHGPGQVVGYPIFLLDPDRRDVHRYLRDLEEVLVRTLASYGVEAGRIPGLTGVWVGTEKIAAIGVRISRWVTSHGFALNVSNDLAPFGLVVPCGIRDKGVTSLARVLGRDVPLAEIMDRLAGETAAVFGRRPA
jgi:lipoate-protein ligase B